MSRRRRLTPASQRWKLENALAVSVSSTVAEIKANAGDQVPQGRLLIAVTPDEDPDAGGAKKPPSPDPGPPC